MPETGGVCLEKSVRLSSPPYLTVLKNPLIDIGGGSTEFVFGGKEVDTYLSLKVGAVHLTSRFLNSDPPTDDQLNGLSAFLEETLSAQVSIPANQVQKPPVLVGIGGTLVNLGAVKLGLTEHEPKRIHGETLTLQEVTDQIRLFRVSTLDDRVQIPGLEPKRADVIIAGAVILRSILTHSGVDQVYVSTRGVRYGIMYERFVGIGE